MIEMKCFECSSATSRLTNNFKVDKGKIVIPNICQRMK